ncbi:D-xylose-binding periplasmic protein precursor [Streptomyces sp. ADI96-02]|uniref:substrate-binding domain-containing protein n=1 Tax=unclassified Streptomyces TaxID=2593676 RepID=UPI000F554B4F|nr:substrate-binding domain-containing protein [Streptomyces sp. ADI96-02]RPK54854.1 D-xylose-binding periplasmic protein precursor [Streptomyces sp. ADI96-02]
MRQRSLRTLAAILSVTAMTASGAACSTKAPNGSAGPGGAGGGPGANAKIAFLMPDLASTRYELYDAPLFTAKTKELCGGCEVLYQNAGGDAVEQQQQADSALAQGVDVLVIDPVDSAAAATTVRTAQGRGVAVIAYDRPIPAVRADYYVSFDNEKIGSMIGRSLVDHLRATSAEGGLLQVNGSPTDAAAGLIKKGMRSAVDSSGFRLLAEYDTPAWEPAKAQSWVSGQISKFPGGIAGVVAANDGTGGASIAAFKAAGVTVPPVTGNDAELAAAQRIIKGDQYNTISKPIKTVAEAAATAAFAFVRGEKPRGNTVLFGTPSELFTPTVVTRRNIAEVLVGGGKPLKASEVCTRTYAAACAAAGVG